MGLEYMNKIISISKNNINYHIDLSSKKFIVLNQELNQDEVINLINKKGIVFPYVLFIGSDIEPLVENKEFLHLFPVKKRYVEFFYQLKSIKNPFRIAIKVNLLIDFFPVFINSIKDIKAIEQLENKKFYDTIIFSPNLNRLELLQLKIHFPKKMLIKAGSLPEILKDKEDVNKYRITDVVQQYGMDVISKNPVYSARYYLRKLDIENLYLLPAKIICTEKDIEVILTYLNIVIVNEQKSKELEIYKEKLKDLKLFYEFLYYIVKNDFEKLENFYTENEKNLQKNEVRSNLLNFLKVYKGLYKNNTLTKEEEIQLWEIEMLIKLKES
jgi:hypothetical protein